MLKYQIVIKNQYGRNITIWDRVNTLNCIRRENNGVRWHWQRLLLDWEF